MPENTAVQFTPEQQKALKTANAHGFINQLVTDGIPDPDKPGQTKSCTIEQAQELYCKAAGYQGIVREQTEKVKAMIRDPLKAK